MKDMRTAVVPVCVAALLLIGGSARATCYSPCSNQGLPPGGPCGAGTTECGGTDDCNYNTTGCSGDVNCCASGECAQAAVGGYYLCCQTAGDAVAWGSLCSNGPDDCCLGPCVNNPATNELTCCGLHGEGGCTCLANAALGLIQFRGQVG
jgi:hypothetical protein